MSANKPKTESISVWTVCITLGAFAGGCFGYQASQGYMLQSCARLCLWHDCVWSLPCLSVCGLCLSSTGCVSHRHL